MQPKYSVLQYAPQLVPPSRMQKPCSPILAVDAIIVRLQHTLIVSQLQMHTVLGIIYYTETGLGKKFFGKFFLRFLKFILGFSVKEDGAQPLRPRKNILFSILHVTSFLFSGQCDVRTQKSRLKYEIKVNLCCKLHTK